jgi:signal transduction histidine kinase
MSVELELEIRNLKQGDHACQLFDSAANADEYETIVSYVKEGLSRGEQCHLIVADADQRARATQSLAAAGVNVQLEVERRALTFGEEGPEVFVAGRFDPRARLDALEARMRQSLAEGFRGLRQRGGVPSGAVVDERAWLEYECLLNDVGRSWKAIALCCHDLQGSPPGFLREVLRVHRKAILGPLVCPNLYYEPPHMALGKASDEDRLRWMIDQLCNARVADRRLERAVQARDDFLSAASHEFRTPLTSALLDLQCVMRTAEGSDQHVSRSDLLPKLQRMKGDLLRFVDVVHRLVDASQLREERVEFRVEPVDLREATRSALERCADGLRRAHCEVNLVAPDEAVVGQWDRMRVEQVVTTLVENAAKFGKSMPIDVTVSGSDGVARLVVRDHGIGICAEDVPRIFGRFEQGVSVSHYGGFGLGLWTASTIVDGLGGRIAVRSEPGSGTTFTVDLPIGGGHAAPLGRTLQRASAR